MGYAGLKPLQKQQLRQSIQDALNRAFLPASGSHGIPVARTMSETPLYFSYLVEIDRSKFRPPGSNAVRRPPLFCPGYSSFIASIVSPSLFTHSLGL